MGKNMDINIKELQNKYGKESALFMKNKKKLKKLVQGSILKIDNMEKSKQLEKIWNNLMLLIGLIKDWSNGSYTDVSKESLVLIIVSLIYLINPFDFIFDVLPIIGHLDDLAVLALVIRKVNDELAKYESWKLKQATFATE